MKAFRAFLAVAALLGCSLGALAHHNEGLSKPVKEVCDTATLQCAMGAYVPDQGEIKILTFHSAQYWGCDKTNHAVFALESLLEELAVRGWVVIPLSWVVEYHHGKRERESLPHKAVAITFDDSFYLDVIDARYDYCANIRGRPTPSALTVLRAFKKRHPDLPEGSPHMTLFVIAGGLESWYVQEALAAREEGLVEIGSHTVTHTHLGRVTTFEGARYEIEGAELLIVTQAGVCPSLLAHPFGEASTYVVEEYLPTNHGCLAAAFTTAGRPLSREDSRWLIPRYVWGWHWTTEQELLLLLGEGVKKIPRPLVIM